jgi:hypothetical protein
MVFGSLLYGFVSGVLFGIWQPRVSAAEMACQPFGIILAEVLHQETNLGDVKQP